jgi:outer membrane protein assembly factor BamB
VTDSQVRPSAFPVVWVAVLALLGVCEASVGRWLGPTVELLKGRHGPYDSPVPIATPIVERLGDANEVAFGPDGHRYRVWVDLTAETDDRRQLWAFRPRSGRLHHLVVAPDGSVYVVNIVVDYMNYTSTLLAFTPAGEQAWQWSPPRSGDQGWGAANGAIRAVSVDAGGSIYVAADTVWALHPDGTVRWRARPDQYSSSLTIRNGLVIGDSVMQAVDGRIVPGPPRTHCGVRGLYVRDLNVCAGTALVAYAGDGAERWRTGLESPAVNPPVEKDGRIFVAAGSLYGVDAAGTIRWKYRPIDFLSSGPVVAGNAIVAAGRHHIVAVDTEGRLLWRVDTPVSGEAGFAPTLSTDRDGNAVVIHGIASGSTAIRIKGSR